MLQLSDFSWALILPLLNDALPGRDACSVERTAMVIYCQNSKKTCLQSVFTESWEENESLTTSREILVECKKKKKNVYQTDGMDCFGYEGPHS